MARVRDWIDGFLVRHKGRFDPPDWPQDDDEFEAWVEGWIAALAAKEATEEEAEEASLALARTPPNWRRDHVPAVLAKIDEIRRASGDRIPDLLQEAKDASRSCEYCYGEGLTVAWAERLDPARRIPPKVSAYCVCKAGRFIKRNHAEHNPELLRRILDFRRVLDGDVPGWLAEPPSVAV